jgi:hypothetical protein
MFLERHLPNGWTFGLPNEVFSLRKQLDSMGREFPPDTHVEVHAPADVAAGKDPGMAKALEILRNGGNMPVHDDGDCVYNFWVAFYSTAGSKREVRVAQITGGEITIQHDDQPACS